jgi:hypothetical protein
MNFIKLLPVILSLLLLGAHFYRMGELGLVLITVVILLILPIRKSWVVRLVQIVLLTGGIEWVRTLWMLAKMRQAAGAPWMRLALILGGVALLTMCSALVFRSRSLLERYYLSPGPQNKSE